MLTAVTQGDPDREGDPERDGDTGRAEGGRGFLRHWHPAGPNANAARRCGLAAQHPELPMHSLLNRLISSVALMPLDILAMEKIKCVQT